MSKKTKTPKFNSVLEDFRKFAGLKVAEEQGDKEQSVSYIPSEADVKKQLPAGGKPFGSNVDPNANRGTAQGEKASDTKEPTTEEESTKETPASAKVASEDEDLVNTLLQSISLVVNETKVASDPEVKTVCKEETKETGKEVPVTSTTEIACEDKTASVNEINEDVLASKIANHFRNVSVGYELGKFLFQTLGQKVAAEGEMPADAAASPDVAAGMEAGGAPVEASGDGGDEVATILQAVQELVQEGQISEEQAQQFLTELQAATQGGGAEGGAHEAAPQEEKEVESEEPVKEEEEGKEAMIAAVNEKVAELVSEGKTDSQIEEYLKEAAANDAAIIVEQAQEEAAQQEVAVFNDYVYSKVASAIDEGASDEQVNEYIKFAKENPAEVVGEINTLVQIENAVNTKVAELKAAGQSEAQIEEYLKQAAIADAATMQQDNIKSAILNKVAGSRKLAESEMPPAGPEMGMPPAGPEMGMPPAGPEMGMPPAGPEGAAPEAGGEEMPEEMKQILQALEELLQSGKITEEEAMAVLKELGIGAEGGAPEGAAPEAPVAPEAQSVQHQKHQSHQKHQ